MNLSNQLLSDVTIYSKYSRYLPSKNRRETWEEIVNRNKAMHIKKYPKLIEEIETNYKYVMDKKVLPSLRGMQFGGKPIEISNTRQYNCGYIPIDHYRAFDEIAFLLLGGSGIGFSVQRHHVDQLPPVVKPTKKRRYLIGDSIEGWSESIKALMKAYLCGNSLPIFDFRDIRPRGRRLITSGGIAPGPEPLKDCLHNIQKVLDRKSDGEKLRPIECHDVVCHIADCILAGGIRRSATLSLFDHDNYEMLTSKYNSWWEHDPQRARANNSALLMRDEISEEQFFELWKKIEASGSGEPGFYWSNSRDMGINACQEASLEKGGLCNLTTMNVADVHSQNDLNNRAKCAAFIGTLQAGYTDFHYVREIWQTRAEKDALLGVSMTGIASGGVLDLSLSDAANVVLKENERVAELIGINKGARNTITKPEGTSSCVLGCSSGIHPYHAPFFIRRMRLLKTEPLYSYISETLPDLVEDDFLKPQTQSVLSFPQKAPEGSVYRTESPIKLLERIKHFTCEWIKPGHRTGANTHSVSATVSIKDKEWDKVGKWMWENKDYYNGLSVIPFDIGSYRQPPFEDCDEETYNSLMKKVRKIDLSHIVEEEDTTKLREEAACSGGACTITQV